MQTLHEASMQPVMEALRYLMGLPGPSGYGSSSTAEQVASDLSDSVPPNLTAIITGATSGIGVETALALAKAGVRRLVIPARDTAGRGEEVRERIRRESPGVEVAVMEMDLSSSASVRSFCSRFLDLGLPLNILINNAGRYIRRLHLTEEKYEMTLATNYLGHYLLTDLLLPKMAETASETGIEGKIVNVSSMAHSWVKRDVLPPLQNLLKPHKYNPRRAYAYSKLANLLHTMELARQLKEGNVKVTVNAVHPGTVKTRIIRDHEGLISDSVCFLMSGLLKSASQGASTTCYVALCPRLRGVSGRYFADCNERSCSSLAQNAGEARKLWLETNAIVHKGDDGKIAYSAAGRSSVTDLIRKQEIRMGRDEY